MRELQRVYEPAGEGRGARDCHRGLLPNTHCVRRLGKPPPPSGRVVYGPAMGAPA
jgi:hypothetical protein